MVTRSGAPDTTQPGTSLTANDNPAPFSCWAKQGHCLRFAALGLISIVIAGVVLWALNGTSGGAAKPSAAAVHATPYETECNAQPECTAMGLEGKCCPDDTGLFRECCGTIETAAELDHFKGMCYSPTPTKKQGFKFETDDYMAEWAEQLWGSGDGHRADLETLASMGVNLVRMYGNDPRQDHTSFLDEADKRGIGVLPSMSDYPYTQSDMACAAALPYDCYSGVKAQYRRLLLNGLAPSAGPDGSRQYHNAVRAVIVINEPELKVALNGDTGIGRSEGYYTKAVLSALDGMLDAEQELHVVPDGKGLLPPFTVTSSFASCPECRSAKANNLGTRDDRPSMPFFFDLAVGALNPGSLGYSPRNDLRAALQDRFVYAFNTQNAASELCDLLLDFYTTSVLGKIPLFIGEFHKFDQAAPAVGDDLDTALSIVQQSPSVCKNTNVPLVGVSFFEFQVSYYKGPYENQDKFGMVGLGDDVIATIPPSAGTNWQGPFDVYCLDDSRGLASAVAKSYGGRLRNDAFCKPKGAVPTTPLLV